MNDVLWSPGEERREATALNQFRRLAEEASGRSFPDYESLWRWSIDDRASFWALVWRFAGVRASRGWETVLENGDAMPGARWFTGARLNYAENLLCKRDDTMAIVCRGEGGRRRAMTFADLHDAVAAMSAWLGKQGVRRGDRVAGYLPNLPETIVAKLATASLGAVWSSSSPDFGTRGVLDRFGQIDPKVLITADGYLYGGRHFDSRPRVAEILDAMPGIGHVVVVPWADQDCDTGGLRDAVTWKEVMATSHDGIDFEQVPFDHPLAILYSSGTTGAPKCIVHGHGGTLLQHLKEHRLHCDIRDGDRLFYFSTCGWMMWNWQVSALATGATLAIYEGHPASPDGHVLWDFCQEERFTAFGASAKYFAAIEKEGIRPALSHDLEDLRLVLSTGSPLAPGSFDYIYRDVKEDVQLASISGGTDIISCFVLGNPEGAVRRGEIQARGLGMAVDIFDDRGNSLPAGRTGELVCTRPFPSMPVGFWNDDDGSLYHQAYFDTFDNVWRHGDWAEITAAGGIVIHGRSDTVLNPGGVRIGTAEIYRQVDIFEEIQESLAVGQDVAGDVRIILFVVMQPGHELDDDLVSRIRTRIRTHASPRHTPARIVAVADIPRTRSNKISELAVRHVIHGRPVANTEALANPESLSLFENLEALKD